MRRNFNDLNGHQVLQLLYTRSGMNWLELCAEFGFEDPNAMQLLWCMETLADANLITADGVEQESLSHFLHDCLSHYSGSEQQKVKIRASTYWRRIQAALLTRFDSTRIGPLKGEEILPYSMNVQPVFGPPTSLSRQMEVFVAMPFEKALEPVYKDHIKKVAETLYLSCGRSDDIFSANLVLQDVWSAICGASAVIGECTGRNPNVFYELGIAHTLGKPVILITQNELDVPFDVRHIRFIEYNYTPRGIRHLEEALQETLRMAIYKHG